MRNKRVVIFGLMLVMLTLWLCQSPVSAATIGYVDFEFLFNNHPEYEMKNSELQFAAEKLTEEFQQEAQSLEDNAEIQSLAAQYEAELDVIADELRVFIVASVQKAITTVAEANQIEVVVPEGIIIVGGIDLTPLVLEAMYSSYGISIPLYLRSDT